MATPQPKSSELKRLIEAELNKPHSDEFALKRFERDADALLKAKDADLRNEGLVIHGLVRALRFDIVGAKQYFTQALAASGYSVTTYLNYASVLGALGLIGEALASVEKAVDKMPDDPAVLAFALRIATDAFDLEKAQYFADKMNKLGALEKNREAMGEIHSLRRQIRMFESTPVTSKALLQRLEAARAVAVSHGVRVTHKRENFTSEGVLVEWLVDRDDDEIAAMNMDASAAVAALEPDPFDAMISFGYTPSKGALTDIEQ